jgi:acyl carrier protein
MKVPKVEPAGPPPITSTSVSVGFTIASHQTGVSGSQHATNYHIILIWAASLPKLTSVKNIQTQQETQLAELIVESLNLEDISAEEIDPDAPLFGDGLGLDSIDALELALAISQKYGVQIRTEDENVEEVFSTLRSLNRFIVNNNP